MSEVPDPTEPLKQRSGSGPQEPLKQRSGSGSEQPLRPPGAGSGTVPPAGTASIGDRRSGRDLPDPVETFKVEDNRIKLLLAIAGMQLIALLLLTAILVATREDGAGERVEVQGQECVVVAEDDGSALYCRR